MPGKQQIIDYARGIASHDGASGQDEARVQRVQALKFNTGGNWPTPLQTHDETSKEHLPPSPRKNRAGVGLRATNPDPAESQNESDSEARHLSNGQANTARPRTGHPEQRDKPFAEDTEDYASFESDFGEDVEMDGVAESKPNVIDDIRSTMDRTLAARQAREKRPVHSPASYPQTSEEQYSDRFQPATGATVNGSRPTEQASLSYFRQNGATPDNMVHGRHSYDPQQRPVDLVSPEPDGQNDGYDKHAARQKFDRAAEYHKAHHRRNSQPGSAVGIPKPTAGTALPINTRPVTTAPHIRGGPHMEKAYGTLGLPQGQHPAHYGQQQYYSSPSREQSAPAMPNMGSMTGFESNVGEEIPGGHSTGVHFELPHVPDEELDYSREVLFQKRYADLAKERFDYDPRNAPDVDADPVDVQKALTKLQKGFKPEDGASVNEAEGFFSHLPLTDWQKAGDILSDQMKRLQVDLNEKREERRSLAKKFEKEIEKRDTVVQRELVALRDEVKSGTMFAARTLETLSPSGRKRRR